MSQVDARRLAGPLPGGSDGATVTLTPWSTGEMAAPPAYLHARSGLGGRLKALGFRVPKRQWVWVPCPVFLLEHPLAGRVLIDTGLPAAAAHDPRAAFGRVSSTIVKFRASADQPLPARLRAAEIEPSSIATVVLTHMHLDHTGSISELPNAKFIVSAAEWAAANERFNVLDGYVKRHFDHAFDYRLVDFEARDVTSFASFGRSFDLFGDGSVTLVSTPGHTRGHMSVVVRLRDREALLCGDAAYTRRAIDEGLLPARMHDEHNFRRSIREIRAYVQMTPTALVVPGHDAEAWERLDAEYR